MEKLLNERLFGNYSEDARPTDNQRHAVNLTLDVALFQIIRLVRDVLWKTSRYKHRYPLQRVSCYALLYDN